MKKQECQFDTTKLKQEEQSHEAKNSGKAGPVPKSEAGKSKAKDQAPAESQKNDDKAQNNEGIGENENAGMNMGM